MTAPRKIAVLIPEVPGQTHSFFWREIEALRVHHGIASQIVSTRLAPRPVLHDWVEEAAAIQLYPLSPRRLAASAPKVLAAMPRLISDARLRPLLQQPKCWAFAVMAARLAQICREKGLEHMHVHSCANFALIAALCHRMTGIPYSLVLHGPLADYGPNQDAKWAGASFVFVITETLRIQVAETLPDVMDKVRVVPMGVNTDLFAPPPDVRPATPDIFTWVCCARLNWVKGHDTLIWAAQILRRKHPELQFRIRIAGEDELGGSGYHLKLDKLIEEAGLRDVVELRGSVTQDEVHRELQSANGFVLASRHEPLGVAYMEAMACELPVIGTDAGGVAELMTNGRDGLLVAPDDPEALSNAMLRLMQDAELRRGMGRAARRRILDNFSSRRSADALAQMLETAS